MGAMPLSRVRLMPLLPIVLLAASCAVPPAGPQATATGASTRPATVVPTPTLAAEIQGPNLRQTAGGGWQALGLLTNRSETTVEALNLSIQLVGPQGQVLAKRPATTELTLLPAGQTSPFFVSFPAGTAAESAALEIASYQPVTSTHVPLTVNLAAVHQMPGGGSRVLGTIAAEGSRGAELAGLSLAVFEQDELVALSESPTAARWLTPGDEHAFEATLPGAAALNQLIAYAVGRSGPLPPAPQVEVELDPGVGIDAQGNAVLAGTLVNQGSQSLPIRLLLTVRQSGRLARVVALASPIPLRPDETRAFGLRLEELPDGDPETTLAVETTIEPLPANELTGIASLTAVINSFEQLGGSVFLRGDVTNAGTIGARDPTLFAAVRNTEGELLAATWLTAASDLPAGQMVPFVLELPLPAEVNLALAEFDLQALGWLAAGG